MTATLVIGLVIVFYLFGAAVHAMNMLSLTGFDWRTAPLKWRVLDVVYLLLDLLVVVGMAFGWKAGFGAFYVAALSQIVLYAALRDWIVDVPEDFAAPEQPRSHLTSLVVFHVVTIALVTWALWLRAGGG